jgi:hypothetical protein
MRIWILSLLLLTTGCVAFPTSHVVFEPISSEGELVKPSACGYMFTDKVLLVIDTTDYKLETRTFADEPEKKLRIFFRIVPAAGVINVDFDAIRIVLDGKEIKYESVTQNAYGESAQSVHSVAGTVTLNKGTNNFYYIEFPIAQQDVEGFELIFREGAIKLGDKQLPIKPIGFKKTKKSDIYVGSING